MPFIHIKSLPFNEPLNVRTVVIGITKDFATAAGIQLEHVAATWTFLSPDHYASAGSVAQYQPASTHPVLVDLLAPDFNSPTEVEKMLSSIASSISKRTKVQIDNIFINYRQAHAGMVFDAGEIVRW